MLSKLMEEGARTLLQRLLEAASFTIVTSAAGTLTDVGLSKLFKNDKPVDISSYKDLCRDFLKYSFFLIEEWEGEEEVQRDLIRMAQNFVQTVHPILPLFDQQEMHDFLNMEQEMFIEFMMAEIEDET